MATIVTAMQRQMDQQCAELDQQCAELDQLRGMVERQRSEKVLLVTKGAFHFAAAIQKMFRALAARRRFVRAHAGAIAIQAVARRAHARQRYRAAADALLAMQARARGSAARRARRRALRACVLLQVSDEVPRKDSRLHNDE